VPVAVSYTHALSESSACGTGNYLLSGVTTIYQIQVGVYQSKLSPLEDHFASLDSTTSATQLLVVRRSLRPPVSGPLPCRRAQWSMWSGCMLDPETLAVRIGMEVSVRAL